MNLNDYYKLELPFVSKNYDNSKKDIYKGIAYFIFQKKDNKLIHNVAQFTEILQGRSNYEDLEFAKGFTLNKYKELIEYRKKSFNKFNKKCPKNGKGERKPPSKFLGDINVLNNLLIENLITVKNVDSFVSASNPSGGLSKANSDPIRYLNKDLFSKINNQYWKVFSLLSNLELKQNNYKKFILKDILNIETINFLNFLEIKNINVVPWGEKLIDINYVNFKKAFFSRNSEWLLKNENDILDKSNFLIYTAKEFININNKFNLQETIMERLNDTSSRESISKILRQYWNANIRNSITKNKYKEDFVKKFSEFERAHIIEQRFIVENYDRWNEYDQERIIKSFLWEDNYLLLPPDIHTYWDKNKIKINSNGKIIKGNITDNEFNELIRNGKYDSITKHFNNVLTKERIILLQARNNLFI